MLFATLLLACAPTDDPPLPEIGGEPVPWEEYAAWLLIERGEKRLGEIALQREVLERARAAGLTKVNRRARIADLARRVARAERVVEEADVRAAWEERYGEGGVLTTLRALRERIVAPADPAAAAAHRAQLLGWLQSRAQRFDADPRAEGSRLLDLGPLRADDWAPDVAATLGGLAVATWSEPLEVRGALYLFRVERAAPVPLESVAAALREELEQAPADDDEVAALLDEIWAGTGLRPLPGLLHAAAPLDAPAAELNGEVLTRDDVARRVARAEGRSLVFAFCGDRVTRAAARAAGISLDPEVLAERARALEEDERARLGGGDERRWTAALARSGEGLAQARRRLARRAELELLQDELVRATRVVSDEDVSLYFDEKYGPGGRDLMVRVLARDADPSSAVDRDLLRLQELVREGADFGALIELNSDDPITREAGGVPPGRFRYEDLEDEYRRQLREARLGDVVGPVYYRRLPWAPVVPRPPTGRAWRTPDSSLESHGYYVLLQLVDDISVQYKDSEEWLRRELVRRPSTLAERVRWTQTELDRVGWGVVER